MALIRLEYHEPQNGVIVKQEVVFSSALLSAPYHPASLFVIKVEGVSMQPKINDQALVIADLSQTTFEAEAIYLVYKDDRLWIKQATMALGTPQFVSINPAFSHLVYDRDAVRIVAKALLTFTAL